MNQSVVINSSAFEEEKRRNGIVVAFWKILIGEISRFRTITGSISTSKSIKTRQSYIYKNQFLQATYLSLLHHDKLRDYDHNAIICTPYDKRKHLIFRSQTWVHFETGWLVDSFSLQPRQTSYREIEDGEAFKNLLPIIVLGKVINRWRTRE